MPPRSRRVETFEEEPEGPMQILQAAHYTLPHYGGIEVAVENLARQLARRGHAVRVLSSQAGGAAREERHGVEFVRIPAWNPLERYAVPYPLFAPSLIPQAAWLARWADIVHGHGFLYQSTLVALGIARIQGRPAVLTEYAGFVRYPRRAWNALQLVAIHTLGRLAVALADVVIVHGIRVHDWIRRLAGPSKAIRLIPIGVDTERFHPATPEERAGIRRALGWDDRPRVLFVGRLVPRKGIEWLLDALDPRYELVLCGRGEMALPARHGLRVYRSPDDDTLLRVYQAADLFILPSHSEGAFPLAAQQALACGLPVIAVYDPLYDPYVHPEVVRWIPPDPAAIREAIRELLEELAGPRGEERRRKAREWACARLSLTHYIDQHLLIYNMLLTSRRKR